ncbi:Detected protein of confused Function [Hibiscus syriacus]|uniref:non-specific serine/threonine protein kinase n=1 Tax=Hibiscus syriacus TaxID=106335 RepID=A0A6A2XKK8_HIBSY|nr:Detected protein of confused Function [Hibiscus syriacus]
MSTIISTKATWIPHFNIKPSTLRSRSTSNLSPNPRVRMQTQIHRQIDGLCKTGELVVAMSYFVCIFKISSIPKTLNKLNPLKNLEPYSVMYHVLTGARLYADARLGVLTPILCTVDPMLHTLTYEYVEGPSVKDVFLEFGSNGVVQERLAYIATQIGDAIGKLHDGGLVHSDHTTSNMLIRDGTNKLVLIDFGLSFTLTLPEDKAGDLYMLERALISMHSSCGNMETKETQWF